MEQIKLLGREQILAAKDRKFVDVEMPEWGGSVRLGSITANTLLRFRDLSKRQSNGEQVEGEMMGVMLSGAIMDAEHKSIFAESDIPALMEKSPDAVTKLFMKALELNNLGTEKKDGETPFDETRKNS